MWTDHLGSGQQPVGLPGWIENPLFGSHQHGTGPAAFGVAADDLHSHRIQNLDLIIIDANHYLAIQWRRSCPIVRLVHLDSAVVIDRARRLLKIPKRHQVQLLQIGFFFRKHLDHLTFAAAVDPLGRPALFPVHEPIVLGVNTVEPTSLQSGALGVFDRVFHRAFAVRIADSGRIGRHSVVLQNRGIQLIELRIIDVRLDHPLF